MLPQPLHPAVVHFPMVLAVFMPISAVLALWAIHRGVNRVHAWAFPFAIALALTGSAFVSIQTGEAEEERVEAYVGEAPLHQHEEAAERFLLLSGVLALVAGVGMLSGTVGAAARGVASVGALLVLLAGVQVGEAGGELVYEHGAAQAYVGSAGPGSLPAPSDERDDDEHRGR